MVAKAKRAHHVLRELGHRVADVDVVFVAGDDKFHCGRRLRGYVQARLLRAVSRGQGSAANRGEDRGMVGSVLIPLGVIDTQGGSGEICHSGT